MFSEIDQLKNTIPKVRFDGMAVQKYRENFKNWFIFNSCALEGNTYSLMDVMVLLTDNITIGGKTLREHNEIINTEKVLNNMSKALGYKIGIDESMIKDINKVLTENIFEGGVYRSCEVRIRGSSHIPPKPEEAFRQIKQLFKEYKTQKAEMHPIEFACYMYAEFERIHPFLDANGMTARLMLNYILAENGYVPIVIKAEDKDRFYESLNEYNKTKDLKRFMKLIEEYEQEEIEFYIQLGDKI